MKIKSYGWVIKDKVNNMGIGSLNICPTVTDSKLKVDLGLLEVRKKD